MTRKRGGYIGWDEFFMLTALIASQRSKDPHTQVGACIAGRNNRILSVGYNGAPKGYDDDEFPWGTGDDAMHDKHNFVVHAEANAILNYRGSLRELEGATAYVTLFPCNECAKLLAQAGIGKVVYLSDKYGGTPLNAVSRDILWHAGIDVVGMDPDEGNMLPAILAAMGRLSEDDRPG